MQWQQGQLFRMHYLVQLCIYKGIYENRQKVPVEAKIAFKSFPNMKKKSLHFSYRITVWKIIAKLSYQRGFWLGGVLPN